MEKDVVFDVHKEDDRWYVFIGGRKINPPIKNKHVANSYCDCLRKGGLQSVIDWVSEILEEHFDEKNK